ncbi:MAG: DUF3052 domain-containing protein [Kordiimonadaceae bacterium]|nr:DUF3052 domain-containing protein [Kordiimonadaceae bacterium]
MAGYSSTPLLKKLGIKAGFRMKTVAAPDTYFGMLGDLPIGVETKADDDYDFVHAFYGDYADFAADLPGLIMSVKRDGMIWISWPKKASKVKTDLSGDIVRATILKTELVDIKVCAVDDVWSGLKCVIRKELR